MKRSTRRYILVFVFLLGMALKKSGIGLSVFLIFPAAIMMAIEMIRSAYTHESEKRLQLAIFIPFSFLLLISVAQLQYWIAPSNSGMIAWVCWLFISIPFLIRSRSGWMQNVLWVIVSILLTSAALMNPRQYHNFYKYSRYEDFMRRRYTETQRGIADMYIDRYKKIDKEKSGAFYSEALEQEKAEKLDEALVNFNKAVDYNPDDAKMIFHRGYFKLSNFELNQDLAYNAIKDFDRAIELDTLIAEFYATRAVALGYVGQKGRASLDTEIAMRLSPDKKFGNTIREKLKRRKK